MDLFLCYLQWHVLLLNYLQFETQENHQLEVLLSRQYHYAIDVLTGKTEKNFKIVAVDS